MTKELTEKEMKELVITLAEPTFKFMMRRVSLKILDDTNHKTISINEFLTVLCATIATIDANALRWMERFYNIECGEKIDFDKLKMVHTKNLYDQLKIILQ